MSTLRVLALGALGIVIASATAGCSADAGGNDQSSSDIVAGGVVPPTFCGGIGGIACPEGLDCHLDGHYPDAGGHCVVPAPVWDRCNVDSDCVAVPKASCCAVDEKEAVNKDHVQDYNGSFNPYVCACIPEGPTLAPPVARTPICQANRCELVATKDIACGGHSPNPHKCPDAFLCQGDGLAVHAPGSCKEIEGLSCGGHTINPVSCPDGYACVGSGLAVDVPGKCTKLSVASASASH